MHKNDIVHLDIKPFTLVFCNADEDSDLKITDFVFAKRLTNECQPHLLSKYHFLINESCVILGEFHFNKFLSGMSFFNFFSAKSSKVDYLFGTLKFLAPEMIECSVEKYQFF